MVRSGLKTCPRVPSEVDKEVVDKMLGRWKDSFAVGGIGGFHWRDLHHGKWLGAQDVPGSRKELFAFS